MLASMRKFLDKYQKLFLMALAVFLVAVFTIPFRQMGGGPRERVRGTLYGEEVSQDDIDSLAMRWRSLELPFFGDRPFWTYLLLRAARERGIQVGSGAIAKMLAYDPPQRETIEFVLADPEALAAKINPTESDLKAYYEKHYADKSLSFEALRTRLRRELQLERATRMASVNISQAYAQVLAAAKRPEGDAWLHALSTAASQLRLEYGQTGMFAERDLTDLFTQDARSASLLRLVDRDPFLYWKTRRGPKPKLPASVINVLFKQKVGEPSRVFQSGDKFFFFRVIKASAGFTAGGALVLKDYGWRHGQFVVLDEYAGQRELIKTKRRLSLGEATRTFEEFLVVQKLVALTCGGRKEVALLAQDARHQLLAFRNEQIRGVAARLPVPPFIDPAPPKTDSLLKFYDARKKTPHQAPFSFGYLQPERVEIEYVLAGPDQLPALRKLTRKAAGAKGNPLPLSGLAEEAGLQHRQPLRPFSVDEIRAVVPELAGDPDFAKQAFSPNLRPDHIKGPDGRDIYVRRLSPILKSGRNHFVFRLLRHTAPHPAEFARLRPDQQKRVARDYMQERATREARKAAAQIREHVARALLAAIAAENKLTVRDATAMPGGELGGASSVPPSLATYVTEKLRQQPGEIARLTKHADSYYTAVITKVDKDSGKVHFKYIRFRPAQFIARLVPQASDIEARARQIRDAELKDKDKDKPDKKKAPPSEQHRSQAQTGLAREWRTKAFSARYLEYLHRRLRDQFCDYIVTLKLPTQVATSGFFHLDDEHPFGGDTKLVKAAFKLSPGTLTGPIVGENTAAVMLLQGTETRKERKIEFVTIRTKDYDPLDETVSDADARAYYDAHRKEFVRPPRTTAEYLFAPFTTIAARLEAGITEPQIQQHYLLQKLGTYKGQKLDDRLRKLIRFQLATTQAQHQVAEKVIREALAAAKDGTRPFAAVAATRIPRGMLFAGSTPALAPDNSSAGRIGYAPALVKQICAAKKGALSSPVKTESGWAIFRVTARTKSRSPAFKETLPAVRSAVRRARLVAKATSALERARTAIAEKRATTIAEALHRAKVARGLPFAPRVVITGYLDFKRAADFPGLTSALRKAAFQAKPGTTTPVVETKGGVQLARVIGAKTSKLVKVYFVALPAVMFAPGVDLAEGDAEAQYNAHPKKYRAPRHYEMEYLLADVRALAAKVKLAPDAVEKAYAQLRDLYVDGKASRYGPPVYRPLAAVRKALGKRLREHKARRSALALARRVEVLTLENKDTPFKDITTMVKGLVHKASAQYAPGSKRSHELFRNVAGLDKFLSSATAGATSPLLLTRFGPIILRVKDIVPAHTPAFRDVQREARRDVAMARGLKKATAMVERLMKKMPASSAAAMTAALPKPTEYARMKRWAVLVSTPYGNRDQAKIRVYRYRDTLPLQMFGLRYGEISPPLLSGEKSDSCYLAILTGIRHQPTSTEREIVSEYTRRIFYVRLAGLIKMIEAQFRATAPK